MCVGILDASINGYSAASSSSVDAVVSKPTFSASSVANFRLPVSLENVVSFRQPTASELNFRHIYTQASTPSSAISLADPLLSGHQVSAGTKSLS